MLPKTKRERLRVQGLCVNHSRCGNPRGEDGTAYECRQCASAANKRQKLRLRKVRSRLRQKGLCIEGCGEAAKPGKLRCVKHLELFADEQSRRRRRQARLRA